MPRLAPFQFSRYQSFANTVMNAAKDASTDAGPITKAGHLRKRIGKRNKFHQRWFVLRGFRLYWYKTNSASTSRGVILLPKEPVVITSYPKMVEKCLTIKPGISRGIELALDDHTRQWHNLLSTMVAYKTYLEQPVIPDIDICNFFDGSGGTTVQLYSWSNEVVPLM